VHCRAFSTVSQDFALLWRCTHAALSATQCLRAARCFITATAGSRHFDDLCGVERDGLRMHTTAAPDVFVSCFARRVQLHSATHARDS
jgi:hypothetical protein